MYPHEHFVVALVPVGLYFLVRYQRLTPKRVVCAVALGSVFPDIVDKPLAYYFFVLPDGRVFMHSLTFAIPLAGAALAYGSKTNRLNVAGAFTVAFLLHPFADFYPTILSGGLPPHLFWPLMSVPSSSFVPRWRVLWSVFSAISLTSILIVLLRDVQLQIQG